MNILIGFDEYAKNGHIQFVNVKDCNLYGVVKILDECYRCPKKVKELLKFNNIERLESDVCNVKEDCSIMQRLVYCGTIKDFLNTNRTSTTNFFIFSNGTWYCSFWYSLHNHKRTKKLLSEYIRNIRQQSL